MQATIRDGTAPAVVVALEPGEKLYAEAGAMMFLSGDVDFDVELPASLVSGLKRAVAGESVVLTTYTARGAGAVGLCGPFPGSIRELELDGELICERHAYLGHVGELAIEPVLAHKRGMGVLGGGEGFVLQKLAGKATVWLHGGGQFLEFDLAERQRLVVDTGCVVAIDPSVQYEVKLQKGIGRALASGEGLFLVYLTGPGHVTLQTVPSRTAARTNDAERGGLLGNLIS